LEKAIAEITIDRKARRIRKINHHASHFTFKCQRCGIFCCKQGGPRLSRQDVDRLERSGYKTSEFLDVDNASLRNLKDGSCIFLSFDAPSHLYTCSIYDLRPTLCRLYPFQFNKSGSDSFTLLLIPCCNGLNAKDGKRIDTDLVAKTTRDVLFELIEADLV